MFSAHTGYIMTLANSIIGVGILAMPFCFQKCGIILAIVLLIISHWVTRICCHFLIKSSLLTRRKSFEFLGFHAFGTSGKLLVELFIIGYLLGTCITYFVVVGDLGPQIVTKMFSLQDGHVHLRTLVMIAVTVVCILPLGMLKNVDSLATVCTASIGFYVCLVIKIVLESEEHIIENDWQPKVLLWEPAGVLQCLPIFSMALSCQMQLFEVFESINNQSLEKLNGIVKSATWICTLVYIAVGFFGYVAFCTQAFSGNILVNLSTSFSSDVIKIGFVLSVAFSFPLVIFPCRASIYSLLYRKGHTDHSGYIPDARFKAITVFIVVFALCIALMIPSVELIIGLVGSTIGVAICILFPAFCFRKIVKKHSSERTLAQFILVAGFCLMILGTYANLSAIDEKRSGSHLEVPQLDESLLKPNVHSQGQHDMVDKLGNSEKQNADLKVIKGILKPKGDVVANLERPKDTAVPPLEKKKEAEKLPAVKMEQEHGKLPVPEEESEPKKIPVEIAASRDPSKLVTPPKMPVVRKIMPVPFPERKLNIAQKKENRNDNPAQSVDREAQKDSPMQGIKNVIPVTDLAPSNVPKKATRKDAPAQAIDKDAIKKDEEVAAEEKNVNKANDDELKKAQKELKETKQLLERTVGELKEKLAEQNKETQNLVVEKLGEVVERVEEIERKVEQQQPLAKHNQPLEKEARPTKEDEPQPKPKGPLYNILTEEGVAQPAENVEPKKHQEVYEPLSYKTGELIEHALNASKQEKRLPLPLALLLNASKLNDIGIEPSKAAEPAKLEQSSAVELSPAPQIPQAPEEKKVNIEAIRRDILQVKDENTPAVVVSVEPPSNNSQRVKRSADLEAIDSKLQQQNCLPEPKVETLMSYGLNNAAETKMKGIGRELKSLKETNNAEQ